MSVRYLYSIEGKTQESVLQETLKGESLLDKISNSKKQIKHAEDQLVNAEIELESAKSKHEEVQYHTPIACECVRVRR